MGTGTQRNQPCWCGSGKKLKHCHLNREQEAPILPWQANKALRSAFSVEVCSVPQEWSDSCTGKIVRAHTVPRSGSLAKIAKDGHVYAFLPSMENLTKNKGKLEPELVGINRASTFSGFCSRHDDLIFSPVEKTNFMASKQQCFLLGYRALSRERYTKQSSVNMAAFRRGADRGRNQAQQVAIQKMNQMFDEGNNAGLVDVVRQKNIYDEVLTSNDFSNVRAYVIEFDVPPPVMCSAAWMPSQDFNGNILQDLLDLNSNLHEMTFTSFWGGDRGAVVFQWLSDDHETCGKLISSLDDMSDDQITGALLRLMFEYFENVQISPIWWTSLSDETRKKLVNRMTAGMNPFQKRPSNVLEDDGLDVESWPITSRLTVGY